MAIEKTAGSGRGRKTEKSKKAKEADYLKDFAPPDHLEHHAKKMWWDLIETAPKNHFRLTDYPMLVMYCESYDTHRKACLEIRIEGMVIFNDKGNPMENPWVNIRQKATRTMNMVATKLRLTPQSRYVQGKEAKEKTKRGTERPKAKSSRKGLTFRGGKVTSIAQGGSG